MKIELLYSSDCPSWQITLTYLNEIIETHHFKVDLKLTKVETNKEAIIHQFTGSPTLRINGEDLFPVKQTEYRLGCRVYKTDFGFQGAPPKEMIEEKIKDFLLSSSD